MFMQMLPNFIALIFSLTATVTLLAASKKIGGFVKQVLVLLMGGIFLSVTAHAAFELAAAFGVFTEDQLLPIMGTLLSVGSMFFIAAAVLAVRKFK